MTVKLKSPPRPLPAAHAKASPDRQAKINAPASAEKGWQRTMRYGWDKGGAKGGRK